MKPRKQKPSDRAIRERLDSILPPWMSFLPEFEEAIKLLRKGRVVYIARNGGFIRCGVLNKRAAIISKKTHE